MITDSHNGTDCSGPAPRGRLSYFVRGIRIAGSALLVFSFSTTLLSSHHNYPLYAATGLAGALLILLARRRARAQ